MQDQSYWGRRQRLRRRRLVQGGAVAGVGLAGLALVGCGGDDDTPAGGSPPGGGGAASPTAETTPVRGGKVIHPINPFPASFDIYTTSETQSRGVWGSYIYSKLVVPKGVPQQSDEFPSQEVVPDLATTWETPDQGLTYTFKLDPKAKWHAPLSRQLVAEDVVFAVNRFLGKTPAAKAAVNKEQLDMVESVSAPDAQTVVFKLKAPSALFMLRLADDYVMPVLPPEMESSVDVTNTGVGTGAWMVDSINRPTGFTFKRNPEWHLGPDKPYIDTREFVVISDPATALSQFKAGNVDVAPAGVNLKDVPSLRSAMRDIVVQLGAGATSMLYTAFSAQDPNSPWMKDPRVRQAFSMSIDRDTLWSAFYPENEFKAAGLEAPQVKWHNVMPVGLGPDWVDPQGSDMAAENKEFYTYAPDKAKALLAAAGYPDGITAEWHYTNGYGPQVTTHGELLQQMVAKGGFKLTTKIDDHNTVFIPKTFLQGDFSGMAQIYQGYGTAMEWFNGMYMPGSSRNQGKVNDQELTAKVQKLNATLDAAARRSQVVEIANYINGKMYYVPGMLGAGPTLQVGRPDIHGLFDYQTSRSGAGFWAASMWKA